MTNKGHILNKQGPIFNPALRITDVPRGVRMSDEIQSDPPFEHSCAIERSEGLRGAYECARVRRACVTKDHCRDAY